MRDRNLSPAIVAGLSFAYLLMYPLAIGRADESHLLYGAKRVLEGQVIYRDFFETLPPVSYYLFAAVYALAGPTLIAARVCIALVQGIGCGLLFHLARRTASTLEAALASVVFAGICIPTWPYASPHWISTTLALAVAALLLGEGLRHSRRARPFVAGLLSGVAICVQQQRGVFLAAWLPIALGVLARELPRDRRWRALLEEVAWAAAGCIAITIPVLGLAAWASSPSAVVYALYGFAVSRYAPTHGGNWWGDVFPLTDTWLLSSWLWLVRISPLFPLADGLLLFSSPRPWGRSELVRACLVLLAILMAMSIWYLPDFIHVSFVLPFLLIPGARLLHGLRHARAWNAMPVGRHLVTGAVLGLLLAALGQAAANVAYAKAIAPARIATAFGELRAEPDVERLFRAVRRHLRAEPDGRALLYSYPDDAWLYLALPAENPTRFSALVEGFFPEQQVDEVLAVLRARGPATVVLGLPFTPDRVRRVVEEGYDAVEDVWAYRIYVRRPAAGVAR